ncbi:MAG: 50S ribosomal protein L4 [Candidatus Levybacteria bacterium]|nr:50S ribosomal protein L4 [Candidatus Levybacteria bacterium]
MAKGTKKQGASKKPVASSPLGKKAARKEKQVEQVVPVEKKTTKNRETVSAKVVDVTGKDAGTIKLPSDIFSASINDVLIAQAIRVFLANQRSGTSSTKTRGEVTGSTRKIYRQKGTGRARHGGIRAPIFVGGGIVFGPKPRDHSLTMSKKMKKKALFSSLSARRGDNALTFVTGVEKLQPKTKEAAKMLANITSADEKHVLFVMSEDADSVKRAFRNLPQVTLLPYSQLTTYAVMAAGSIVFTKDAAEKMSSHFLKG